MTVSDVVKKYGFPVKQYRKMTLDELKAIHKRCTEIETELTNAIHAVPDNNDYKHGFARFEKFNEEFRKTFVGEGTNPEAKDVYNAVMDAFRKEVGETWRTEFKAYQKAICKLDEERHVIDGMIGDLEGYIEAHESGKDVSKMGMGGIC